MLYSDDGQYLRPSSNHLPVEQFVPLEEFAKLEEDAVSMGFKGIACAPTARSSYEAEILYEKVMKQR